MTEIRVDVLEKLREVQSKINEYLEKTRSSSGNIDVEIQNMSFNVGKKEKTYIVGMKMDFSLLPKNKQNQNSKIGKTRGLKTNPQNEIKQSK